MCYICIFFSTGFDMPKQSSKEIWRHPVYNFASCHERFGVVHFYVNYKGKRYRKSSGIVWDKRNKQVAFDELEEYLNEVIENKKAIDKSLFDLWCEYKLVKYPNLVKESKRKYESAFLHFIKDNYLLSDIEGIRKHILNNIYNSKLSKTTINKLLSLIKGMFNYAFEEGYIARNPITKKMIPKDKPKRILPYTLYEVQRMLLLSSSHEDKSLHYLIRLISLTGMRISEAIYLKPSDIQLDYAISIIGKGGKFRQIPLIPFPELNNFTKELIEFSKQNQGRIFHWKDPRYAQKLFKRFVIKNNIRPLGFHAIRKYFENHLINNSKIPINTVAQILGHTVAIQQKHYIEILGVEKMTEIISGQNVDNNHINSAKITIIQGSDKIDKSLILQNN